MKVEPYLAFDGRCEEAAEFYKKVLGAEIAFLSRFKEMPDAPEGAIPPGYENKVLHMLMKIGDNVVMATDGGGCSAEKYRGFSGFSLTISVDEVADAESKFKALSEGGTVNMPIGPSFFAKAFGVLTDKFGVSWMVLAGADPA